MTHPAAILFFMVLAIAYGVQFLVTLLKLEDDGVVFEKYKSQAEFWWWLLIPIIPIVLEVIVLAKKIGK